MRYTQHLGAALLAAIFFPAPAPLLAQSGVKRVDLLPGWVEPDGTYIGAVRIALEPGWKTYWRMPGEGGIPAQFDWSGSRNITSATVHWPTPQVFHDYGMESYGYSHEVTLPIVFELMPGAQQAAARLTLNFGVCADICIPARAQTSVIFDLNQTANTTSIGAALSQGPTELVDRGVEAVWCSLAPGAHGAMLLTAQMDGGALGPDPVIVVETGNPGIRVGRVEVSLLPGGHRIAAPLDYFGEGALAFERGSVQFHLLTPERVFEHQGC